MESRLKAGFSLSVRITSETCATRKSLKSSFKEDSAFAPCDSHLTRSRSRVGLMRQPNVYTSMTKKLASSTIALATRLTPTWSRALRSGTSRSGRHVKCSNAQWLSNVRALTCIWQLSRSFNKALQMRASCVKCLAQTRRQRRLRHCSRASGV